MCLHDGTYHTSWLPVPVPYWRLPGRAAIIIIFINSTNKKKQWYWRRGRREGGGGEAVCGWYWYSHTSPKLVCIVVRHHRLCLCAECSICCTDRGRRCWGGKWMDVATQERDPRTPNYKKCYVMPLYKTCLREVEEKNWCQTGCLREVYEKSSQWKPDGRSSWRIPEVV